MSESQGGAGRREVAWRLFAAEFDDADYSYSQSDEERAPNYVVTPTGARVNRLFVVGVLTEIETVSEDYLRARVVDPTGPFVIYAGQYQPDALAFLEQVEPPTFVAVTGKARTYQPDDSDQVFTSVRPESISEVEAATRDRWVVQTAEQTSNRVARMAEAKHSGLSGDELQTALEAHDVEEGLAAGIPLALDHYGTTGDYLAAVRQTALDAARVVADEIDEAESLDVLPGQGGDDAIADLVERPIDVDTLGTGDDAGDETVDEEPTASESEENAAEAGAGNGSAIGTAESSSQADSTPESETGETTTDGAADASTVDSADEGGTDSVAEPARESTDAAASEPADEPADTAPETGDTSTGEDMVTNEPADAAATGDEASADAATDSPDATANPDSPSSGDDDLEDFEPEFDLDEDEREELEEEFGTEFQSGTEVSEPGEAGIETPDPDEPEGDGAEAGADAAEQAEGTAEATGAEPTTEIDDVEETEPADDVAVEDEDEEATETEAAEDDESAEDVDLDEVDLEDAVMDAMSDLDDGDGAQRDDVLAAVVDRTGADPGDVEDAIQDALMGGRCYEPDDATLKPI
ncbi:hypothetical protein SAMN05216559_3270 [Halomicrobium zhouii]|uniref:Rpa-associated protein n=1 Tax=Halomicrobium zhouii TaxID=767519 RepID=A0A1I6LWN8_9EURY|nr:hypothetical protein [Halomicrobium zhouii]SFS07692.1 hypothetical protein SAMN05216559_3270 [Halomicrobium zhouii]